MSEMAKKARADAKEKVQRIAAPHKGDVDASGWTEPTLNAGAKTGMRPISPRAYKKGGKVVKAEGAHAMHHAGRKPRKSGGSAKLTPNNLINRNAKDANEERGYPHVGGYKKGGRTGKMMGGQMGGMQPPMGAQASPTMSMDPRSGAAALMGAGSQMANVPANRMGFGVPPRGKLAQEAGLKRGGHASHPDEKEDKALINKMVKSECRTERKSGGGNWIKSAVKHPGALHKELHVKEGEKIPAKKLAKAEHSVNPTLARRARLAETLKHMHHAKGGKAEDNYEGGTRPTGGRMARATGGKAGKGKMNVNIIIGAGGKDGQNQMPPSMMGGPKPTMAPPPMMPRPKMPMGGPPPGMPPMPPSGAPPMGGPGMPPSPMPRKSGGRALPKMEFGGGGGLGRLEKVKEYGLTNKR